MMMPEQSNRHQSTPLLLLLLTITLVLCLPTTILPLVHAIRPSSGCTSSPSNTGLGSTLSPGEWMDFNRTISGTQQRTHRLTIPSNYLRSDDAPPSPILYYFHGWGGNHQTCGSRCQHEAANRGFISVALTGYGPPKYNSWKIGGSSSSPGPEGPTCTPTAAGYCTIYSNDTNNSAGGGGGGCACGEAANCWWTTCLDSIAQTLAILDEVEERLCVDLDQVWAVGCSNGGMFTLDLAADERSAARFAGIVPVVGLPHYGFSTGPLVEGIRMMGMWGSRDTSVPPISNTDNPDKTLDTSYNGWYYTSADKVMDDWTSGNGCRGTGQDPLDTTMNWGIGVMDNNTLRCTMGCSERADGVRVVGCIFDGGHVCDRDTIWEPIFHFMLDRAAAAPSPASEIDC